jgi:hypothetical protein
MLGLDYVDYVEYKRFQSHNALYHYYGLLHNLYWVILQLLPITHTIDQTIIAFQLDYRLYQFFLLLMISLICTFLIIVFCSYYIRNQDSDTSTETKIVQNLRRSPGVLGLHSTCWARPFGGLGWAQDPDDTCTQNPTHDADAALQPCPCHIVAVSAHKHLTTLQDCER